MEPTTSQRAEVLDITPMTAPRFEEFFESEHARLARALYLLTGSAAEADELTQEAMVRVYERWDRVQRMDSPQGYLFRTALNLHRSHLRSLTSRRDTSSRTRPRPTLPRRRRAATS